MKPLVVRRSPAACYLLAAAALAAHVLLSYPAAVRRGFPPIHPFWEYVAPYLAYPAIALFPLFDDSPKTLRGAKLKFLWAAVFMNGVTLTNLTSGRPSIGHLSGFMGIIWTEPSDLPFDELARDTEGPATIFRKSHGIDIRCAHVVYADGHEHWLDADSAPIFKSLLTASGGERISTDY